MTLNDAVFICVTRYWQWLASRLIDQIIHKSERLFDPGYAIPHVKCPWFKMLKSKLHHIYHACMYISDKNKQCFVNMALVQSALGGQ